MLPDELIVVLIVFDRQQNYIAEKVNPLDILLSCRQYLLLSDDVYTKLLRRFRNSEHASGDQRMRMLLNLLEHICEVVSFPTFLEVLNQSGFLELSMAIKLGLKCQPQTHRKRALPHADTLNKLFTTLKCSADSKGFQDGTIFQLRRMISHTGKQIEESRANPGKYQFLVDKRVLIYFLLAQQYSTMDERFKVMKEMRDCMPNNDIDRTFFDTLFHSYMVVIWAIKGDMKTAEKHAQKARLACELCVPGLSSILLRFCIQYKDNLEYFRKLQAKDLEHATTDFQEIFQMFDFLENGTDVYKRIAILELLRTLLGVDWNLKVRPIEDLNEATFVKAKEIMSSLTEPEEERRKMLYHLCQSRLCEKECPKIAAEKAKQALREAREGSYYDTEIQHLRSYILFLEEKRQLDSPAL